MWNILKWFGYLYDVQLNEVIIDEYDDPDCDLIFIPFQ
jgi:hypothetical protein